MKANWKGREVWNHIVEITPDSGDVPSHFKTLILPRNFTYQAYNLKDLLKTDPDFAEYYEAGHDRYKWEEKRPSDLDLEIVVVNGELLDGYSRVSELLRGGRKVTNAFVAIDKIKESLNEAEETYKDYPAAAKANAKKAIDWKEEYGRDEVKGGTPVGWQRAHQLAKGEALSRDVVSRMAQFNRHRKNSKVAPEHKDEPWKDNGYIAWLIWGGDEGVDWAMKKMDQIKKEESNENKIYTMKKVKLFEQFVDEAKSSKELASHILNVLDDNAQLHTDYIPKEALKAIETAINKSKGFIGKDAEKAAKQIRMNLEDIGILSNTFSPFDVELMIMNHLNENLNEASISPDTVRQLADEINGELYVATIKGKTVNVKATTTSKTFDDGVPMLKYMARSKSASTTFAPPQPNKIYVVHDYAHGWWYFTDYRKWYGLHIEDGYGEPSDLPFDSMTVTESLDEATTSWSRMMKGVKAGGSGPWSLVAIENNKVVGQKINIRIKDILPAEFEAMRKEYPRAKIHIEDAGGMVVWNESMITESHFNPGDKVTCIKSGMTGEVVSSEGEGSSEIYSVKMKDGKIKEYSPEELKLSDAANEAVSVETSRYKFAHSKEPRGTGMWAFSFDRRGEDTFFAPKTMSYADAKAWAISQAKEAGKSKVYVMESIVNEAKELSREDMMNLLQSKYKFDFVRTTEDFDGSEGGIWVSGESSPTLSGKPIYNYYGTGGYDLGVLSKYEDAINKLGWYSEWYDAGTVMIWPI